MWMMKRRNSMFDPEKQSKTPTHKKPPTKKPIPKPTKPPTPVPSPVPSPISPSLPTSHKGIYAFSASNASTLANHASIAGINLIYPWILINPSQGAYNWNVINSDMQPWVDNDKSIILRAASVGWRKWGPPLTPTNSWVPDDVLKRIPTTTSGDKTVKP